LFFSVQPPIKIPILESQTTTYWNFSKIIQANWRYCL